MKNLAGIILLSLLISACNLKSHDTAQEKMLLGRWVTTDQTYNKEWLAFKADGSFADTRYLSDMAPSLHPVSFSISEDQLILKYKGLFSFPHNANYRIVTINDSTLIIATRATKHYPSETYHLKKMKLNGKFIGG